MSVDIYFGTIKNVEDKDKLCRCQVVIPGKTNEIEETKLPWYYAWQGLNYLPEKDEVVAVLIFDDNFTTGFYGPRIGLDKTENTKLDGEDYKNYLEIFRRQVEDKNVQLTYTKSKGIEFHNDKSGEVIEIDKIQIFVGAAHLMITEDLIELGTNGFEYSLLGDKSVKHLKNIIKHQQATINNMYQGFQTVMNGCTHPFTLPIKIGLAAFMPTKASLVAENSSCKSEADTIQSKQVKIGTK